MAERMDAAQVAKLVRRVLRDRFPDGKFSVTTDKYAGGASISVRWTDGPGLEAVDAEVQRFSGATFDGMTDMKEYLPDVEFEGESFSSGADYIMTQRELSTGVYLSTVRGIVEAAGMAMPEILTDGRGNAWVEYAGYPQSDTEVLRRGLSDFMRNVSVS